VNMLSNRDLPRLGTRHQDGWRQAAPALCHTSDEDPSVPPDVADDSAALGSLPIPPIHIAASNPVPSPLGLPPRTFVDSLRAS
jgi:hypothetical protein